MEQDSTKTDADGTMLFAGDVGAPAILVHPRFPCCRFGIMRRGARGRGGAGSRHGRTWFASAS